MQVIHTLSDQEVEEYQEKGEITKSGFTFVEGDLRVMYKFDTSKEAHTYDAHSDKQVSINRFTLIVVLLLSYL